MHNKFASHSPPVALSIAGSDSGGGAGIQADLKTFAALDVFGCSAITAITAQNTRGVDGIWPLSAEAVAAQLHSVLNDLPVRSIKTGMLYQASVVAAVVASLAKYPQMPVVMDPVLVATSGDSLSADDSLIDDENFWRLLRSARVVTPNLEEAAQLVRTTVATTEEAMCKQGDALIDAGLQAVLIKGGHLSKANVDWLFWREGNQLCKQRFSTEKIPSNNTHGTGCTLSAAIAAQLAKQNNLVTAVANAKKFITRAIAGATDWQLGRGRGPVNHFVNVTSN